MTALTSEELRKLVFSLQRHAVRKGDLSEDEAQELKQAGSFIDTWVDLLSKATPPDAVPDVLVQLTNDGLATFPLPPASAVKALAAVAIDKWAYETEAGRQALRCNAAAVSALAQLMPPDGSSQGGSTSHLWTRFVAARALMRCFIASYTDEGRSTTAASYDDDALRTAGECGALAGLADLLAVPTSGLHSICTSTRLQIVHMFSWIAATADDAASAACRTPLQKAVDSCRKVAAQSQHDFFSAADASRNLAALTLSDQLAALLSPRVDGNTLAALQVLRYRLWFNDRSAEWLQRCGAFTRLVELVELDAASLTEEVTIGFPEERQDLMLPLGDAVRVLASHVINCLAYFSVTKGRPALIEAGALEAVTPLLLAGSSAGASGWVRWTAAWAAVNLLRTRRFPEVQRCDADALQRADSCGTLAGLAALLKDDPVLPSKFQEARAAVRDLFAWIAADAAASKALGSALVLALNSSRQLAEEQKTAVATTGEDDLAVLSLPSQLQTLLRPAATADEGTVAALQDLMKRPATDHGAEQLQAAGLFTRLVELLDAANLLGGGAAAADPDQQQQQQQQQGAAGAAHPPLVSITYPFDYSADLVLPLPAVVQLLAAHIIRHWASGSKVGQAALLQCGAIAALGPLLNSNEQPWVQWTAAGALVQLLTRAVYKSHDRNVVSNACDMEALRQADACGALTSLARLLALYPVLPKRHAEYRSYVYNLFAWLSGSGAASAAFPDALQAAVAACRQLQQQRPASAKKAADEAEQLSLPQHVAAVMQPADAAGGGGSALVAALHGMRKSSFNGDTAEWFAGCGIITRLVQLLSYRGGSGSGSKQDEDDYEEKEVTVAFPGDDDKLVLPQGDAVRLLAATLLQEYAKACRQYRGCFGLLEPSTFAALKPLLQPADPAGSGGGGGNSAAVAWIKWAAAGLAARLLSDSDSVDTSALQAAEQAAGLGTQLAGLLSESSLQHSHQTASRSLVLNVFRWAAASGAASEAFRPLLQQALSSCQSLLNTAAGKSVAQEMAQLSFGTHLEVLLQPKADDDALLAALQGLVRCGVPVQSADWLQQRGVVQRWLQLLSHCRDGGRGGDGGATTTDSKGSDGVKETASNTVTISYPGEEPLTTKWSHAVQVLTVHLLTTWATASVHHSAMAAAAGVAPVLLPLLQSDSLWVKWLACKAVAQVAAGCSAGFWASPTSVANFRAWTLEAAADTQQLLTAVARAVMEVPPDKEHYQLRNCRDRAMALFPPLAATGHANRRLLQPALSAYQESCRALAEKQETSKAAKGDLNLLSWRSHVQALVQQAAGSRDDQQQQQQQQQVLSTLQAMIGRTASDAIPLLIESGAFERCYDLLAPARADGGSGSDGNLGGSAAATKAITVTYINDADISLHPEHAVQVLAAAALGQWVENNNSAREKASRLPGLLPRLQALLSSSCSAWWVRWAAAATLTKIVGQRYMALRAADSIGALTEMAKLLSAATFEHDQQRKARAAVYNVFAWVARDATASATLKAPLQVAVEACSALLNHADNSIATAADGEVARLTLSAQVELICRLEVDDTTVAALQKVMKQTPTNNIISILEEADAFRRLVELLCFTGTSGGGGGGGGGGGAAAAEVKKKTQTVKIAWPTDEVEAKMALPHAVQLLAAHLIADWAATARHMLLATGAFDGLRPLLQSPDSWLRWTAARACHRLLHISGWDCWVTVTYSTEAMAAADKAGVLTALAGMLAEAPEALSAPKDMVGYNVDQQHHSRSRRFARGTVSHLFHFLAADATRGSVYKHAVDAAVEALQQLADQGAGGDSNLAVTTRTAATEVAGLTVPSHIEALMRPGGGGSGIPLDEQTATALHALLRAQLSAAAAERIQRAGALKRLGELLAESGKMPPAAGDGGSPAEAVLVLSFPGEADATLPLPVALQLLSAALVSKLASVFEGLRQPLQDVGALDARDRAALGLYAQLGLTSFPPLEQGTPPSSSCSAAAGAAAWLAVRGVFRPGGRTRSKLTRFAMDALTSAHECGALSRIADLMAVAPAECDQTSDVVGEFVYWSSGEKEAAAAFKPALQAAVAAVAALMEHDDKHVVSEAVQKATDWLRWWSAEDYLPHIAELLFSTGVAAKMVERLIKSESDRRACSYYMNRFRNIVCFLPDALRQSLRDLGLLAAAKRIIHKYMHVINRDHTPALMAPFQATSFLYEVARSTSLHTSLRELGTLAVVKAILSKCNHDTLRARALIIVAHVYGGDESCAEAQQLLVEQDISTAVLQFLKAGLFNKGRYGGFFWNMDATVDAAQSLTRTPQNAERLARAGLLPLVLQALSQNATNARVVEPACKALLNMATVKSLRTALLDAKVPDAIRPFADAAAYSLRVSDAARGCLLHLGQLQDQQAQEAIAESEAAAGAAGGGAPGGSAGAAAAAGGFRPGAAPSQPQQPSFDVFLSHKRTDSKDFARALYNLLVLRGISCFLDFEYREELSDLESIVASCANLVFILTDNIFESQWCMKELVAAAKNNVNIILVVKEGSRWKDKHGNRTHDFPPYWLLDSLQPPEVRSVFSRKSIAHSDEYYQAFVDTLLSKIKLQAPQLDAGAGGSAAAGASQPASGPPNLVHNMQPPTNVHQRLVQQQQQQQGGSSSFHAHAAAVVAADPQAAATAAGAMAPAAAVAMQQQQSAMAAAAVASLVPTAMQWQAEVATLRREQSADVQQLGRQLQSQVQQLQQSLATDSLQLARSVAVELQQVRQDVTSQMAVLPSLRMELGNSQSLLGREVADMRQQVASMQQTMMVMMEGMQSMQAAYLKLSRQHEALLSGLVARQSQHAAQQHGGALLVEGGDEAAVVVQDGSGGGGGNGAAAPAPAAGTSLHFASHLVDVALVANSHQYGANPTFSGSSSSRASPGVAGSVSVGGGGSGAAVTSLPVIHVSRAQGMATVQVTPDRGNGGGGGGLMMQRYSSGFGAAKQGGRGGRR